MQIACPESRPQLISDKSAWAAADFASPQDYRRSFSPEMIDEIGSKADELISMKRDLKNIGYREIALQKDSSSLITALVFVRLQLKQIPVNLLKKSILRQSWPPC